MNECYQFAGTDLGCQNGASCQNLPGTYRLETEVGAFCASMPLLMYFSLKLSNYNFTQIFFI